MVAALTGRQSVSFVCDYLLELAYEGGLFCYTQATASAVGRTVPAERPFFLELCVTALLRLLVA